ncbi:MAG: PSD1 and planctomycete cytochrome C domain-containing protein [Pirellulales bacterium]
MSRVAISNSNLIVQSFAVAWMVWWFCGPGAVVESRGESPLAPATLEFNRDIRPLLADNCFACHGPDKNKREADLRLDTQDGLFRRGDSGANIVPGKPDESQLVRRIESHDDEQRMPPPDSGKQLSDSQRALLRRWIEQGAPWEGHWAFQPIKRPTPPDVPADVGSAPVRNPIDQFVREQLRGSPLAPASEADRVTLIRRLSFDLRGIPPTVAEVDQFVLNQDPKAYEQLVDRLLASPQFGERMAHWWLDLVRYADSVGYHGDQPVSVYPYREYVIRSFNQNKRFDQFTVEQLAGDLLPNATLEQKVASGYNRLGMMSAEGGVQDKEYLAKYIAERVRNVSGAWLGVTLGCSECHDHKYDAFTSRDFYSMEAFFADIEERGLYSGAHATGAWGPTIRVPTETQAARLTDLDRKLADLRAALERATPELAAEQLAWEKSQVQWLELAPVEATSENGASLEVRKDGSVLASGKSPATDVYKLAFSTLPASITAIRLEVLPDDSLPKKGPGRASNGNFVLTEFQVETQENSASPPREVKVQEASATYEQTGAVGDNPYGKWAIAAAIDADAKGPGWGWAVMEQVGKPLAAVFELSQPITGGADARLTVTLRQNHSNPGHTLGRFRLAVTQHPLPVKATGSVPSELASIVRISPEQRNDEQRKRLADYYRSIAPSLEPRRQELAAVQKERDDFEKQLPTTLVTVAVTPRVVRVLPRGNWMDDSGEVMRPAFPSLLPSLASASNQEQGRLTRLDLARWLVAPENPLTARTLANRLWKLFLGSGLSRKLDDLGAQGEWPSHPLLLDWLASQLIDSGWDLKALIKTIVMSHTYRQSSAESPRAHELDPYNRLLTHQSRFRLDAEFVRDNALVVSGLWVDKLGGPSVRPYQPPGYWAYLNFPQREWENGKGEELYRRGLYTHWQRQYLHPSLMAFDAPSREECAADRTRSNTPLQSLVLLNDPSYVEAARAFAELTLREGGNATEERLTWMFRRALSRAPRAEEIQVLTPLLEKHLAEYRADGKAAETFLAVGTRPAPPTLDRAELAAWTSVARVIMNLHEFITRF